MRFVHSCRIDPRFRRALGLGLVLLSLLFSGSASAEIYQWRDAQGRLHFAQDLNQVPIEYRAQARGDVVKPDPKTKIQHYEVKPAAAAAPRRRSAGTASGGGGRVHKIRVERTGSTMRVNVRLNDRVVAPFYVDTGASDVVIPESVARQLGLDLEGARTAFYGTANGTIQQSLVTLESVQLGGARAENVPASVSTSMSTGLLGLSFFNHFRYRVDPVSGTITLQDNGLVEAGKIRGGRSEGQWRRQFAALAARRAAIERAIDSANPNRSRRKAELEAMIEEVDRQLDVLEDEADEARVPMRWRD
ncbi:MAG: TIGR02281 family clan AA aspartic protease [Myxococcota bacterium]